MRVLYVGVWECSSEWTITIQCSSVNVRLHLIMFRRLYLKRSVARWPPFKKVILKRRTSWAAYRASCLWAAQYWTSGRNAVFVFTDIFFVSNTITATSRIAGGSLANNYKNDGPLISHRPLSPFCMLDWIVTECPWGRFRVSGKHPFWAEIRAKEVKVIRGLVLFLCWRIYLVDFHLDHTISSQLNSLHTCPEIHHIQVC